LFRNLSRLVRYRGLIHSLVARELKARYRGSVLGFLWSFINPLLLILIYSFIFTTIMPNREPSLHPFALFMLCGILPWTWFSASLTEASGSLIAGGNLIKKVLFPAEVLPIVSVLANMVHFFLALPIVALVLIRAQRAFFLVLSLRHDLTPELASSVFHRLARDETVGRVNIFPTIVVKIDEAAAPGPAGGKPSHF